MNTRNRSAVAWRKADWEGTAQNAKQRGIQYPNLFKNQNPKSMKNVLKALLLVFVIGAFFSACQKDTVFENQDVIVLKDTPVIIGDPQPEFPVSFGEIEPYEYPGNFVADDDEDVCYKLSALGYIGEVTDEMRGVKVDIPGVNTNSDVDILIHGSGRYLAWDANDHATVLAFVIKGGPNYHVYDYVGSGLNADSWLASPKQKNKIVAISHYNFCYTFMGDGSGCTPGYWRNHYDRWKGYTADQIFNEVFGVTYLGANVTLGMAVSTPQTYGTFAFHAVAALLNSTGGTPNTDGTTVDYPLNTEEVIALVKAAVAAETTEIAKDILAGYNEAGCPLGGTAACSPRNPAACLP
jgi:hypothetical protein